MSQQALSTTWVWISLLLLITTCYSLKCRTDDGPSEAELKRITRTCMRKIGENMRSNSRGSAGSSTFAHSNRYGPLHQTSFGAQQGSNSRYDYNYDYDDDGGRYNDNYNNNNNNNDDNKNNNNYNNNNGNYDRGDHNDRGDNRNALQQRNRERQQSNRDNNRSMTSGSSSSSSSSSNGNNNNNGRHENNNNNGGSGGGGNGNSGGNNNGGRSSGNSGNENSNGSGNGGNSQRNRNQHSNSNNNNNNNNNSQNSSNDTVDGACIVHCFFEQMNMLNSDDYPDRYKVQYGLTRELRDRELRNFYTETIQDCFHYMESQRRRDKCHYSRELISCMTEYAKVNCDDWQEFNVVFN